MGRRRQSSGVEIREVSIRIVFSHQGKQQKETLYLDNDSLPPTPANVRYAIRIAAEVKDKIRTGLFDYAAYFPHSPKALVNQESSVDAFQALKRQKAWTYLDESGRVFHNQNTNKPWAKEQNIREPYWNPTLKLLGIRRRRPYCTRATYATVELMAGARPAYMATQLGHSLDVFYRDFAKWISHQDDDREMIKIEAQINENIPETFTTGLTY